MRYKDKHTGIFRCLSPGLHGSMTLYPTRLLTPAVLLLLLASCSEGCPLPANTTCRCQTNDKNEYIINCRYLQLEAVPTFLDTQIPVYELTLFGNKLKEIPPNAFSVLNVRRINLGNNPLSRIDDDAFNGVRDSLRELVIDVDADANVAFPTAALAPLILLQELQMTDFDLFPSLPTDALKPLANLQKVSIVNCGLQSIAQSDFASQNRLETLVLTSNAFREFPKTGLSTISSLKVLDITQNAIRGTLPQDAFKFNDKLVEVDLSNNHIGSISEGAFNNIQQKLKILHLRSNLITWFDLQKIQTLQAVEDLDLSYNQELTQLPYGMFNNMHSLKKLTLHGCSIQHLKENTFRGIKDSLVVLQLAENKLNSIGANTFSGFIKLEDLYMGYQDLSKVLNASTFHGLEGTLKELYLEKVQFSDSHWPSLTALTTLTKLKLKDNKISSIPDFIFDKFKHLQSIDVSTNSIKSISQRTLHGLQNSLTYLNLANNQLTTLDQCVNYGFTGLREIILTKNPLVCDCHLKWLKAWVELNYDEPLFVRWTCDKPDQHKGKLFTIVKVEDMTCDVPPPPIKCEVYTTTTRSTTTTIATTVPQSTEQTSNVAAATTSEPGPVLPPLTVNLSDVTATSCHVFWQMPPSPLINNFEIQVIDMNTNIVVQQDEVSREVRDYVIKKLRGATEHKICVTMWTKESATVLHQETGCVSFNTLIPASQVSTAGTPLSTILGAILAVVAVLILLAILGCLFVRYRNNDKGTLGSWIKKKTTSNSTGLPSRNAVPRVGYDSKRFSKARHIQNEIDKQNMANKNIESHKNFNFEPPKQHINLKQDLDRFSPEEQDRILSMLSYKEGAGTHLSTISSGSQRYLPDLPHRPPQAEGYLYPTDMRGAAAAAPEEPHIYMEIDSRAEISKECYI